MNHWLLAQKPLLNHDAKGHPLRGHINQTLIHKDLQT